MSPYANVDSIKLYGDGDLTKQTSGSLVKQLDMLQEVAGIDIRGMLNGALMHQAGNQPVVDAIKGRHADTAEKAPQKQSEAPQKQPAAPAAPATSAAKPAATSQSAASAPTKEADKPWKK